MKGYAVIFEESAQADVAESYDWGRRTYEACRDHYHVDSSLDQFRPRTTSETKWNQR